MDKTTYKKAGVDIAKSDALIDNIKASVEKTYSKAVLSPLGGFAGLYDLADIIKNYQAPALVQSIDGVGTKTVIAAKANNFDNLGEDLVSATANDILVLGAKPLTMLDYVAASKLDKHAVSSIIKSVANACLDNGISLIGGETAEMPDVYHQGEHDIVGIVTGVVDKTNIIDGRSIKENDSIIALSSSGLHTNGFSLARYIFFKQHNYAIDTYFDALGQTLGEALLAPHINYTNIIHALLGQNIAIKGMAHITGGGIIGNLKRTLPFGISAHIETNKLQTPAIFPLMQELGNMSQEAMYQAFNMGAGFMIVLDKNHEEQTLKLISETKHFTGTVVGETYAGQDGVRLQ